ncbi:MAG: ABC transporter substrate-binding protein [Eubacteriales bacterium]
MKKALSALLCLSLLVIPLTSCKKDPQNDSQSDIPEAKMQTVDHVYAGSYVSISEDIYLRDISLSGGKITSLATEILDRGDPETGEGYKSRMILYSVDTADGSAEITELPRQMKADDENTYISIQAVATGADGSFAVAEYSINRTTNTYKHLLTGYDAAGKIVYSIDPEPLNEIREDPRAAMRGYSREYEFYVNSMTLGGNGTLYLVNEYSIIAISAQGERLYEIAINGYVDSMSALADGRVLVKYMDYSDYEDRICFLDDEKRGLSDPLELPAISTRNYDLYLGVGYDYYIKTSKGLYGLNDGDADMTLLCDWINSDVLQNGIRNLCIIDAENFVYVGNDPVTGNSEIAIMKKVPDDQVEPRYLIRVARSYSNYDFTSYVVKFNRSNDKYRVTVENYSDYNTNDDYTAGQTRLTNEILAGQVPDILCSDSYNASYSNFAEKGVFADLYPFIDSDPNLGRDKFMSCVLTPFETDGKLYQLATSFNVGGFVGKTKNLGAYKDWTIDTFFQMIDDCNKAGKSAFDEVTRENMQSLLINYNLGSYIDYDKAVCSFDSDAFRRTLDYLKTLQTSEQYYADYDYETARRDRYAGLRDDKILMQSNAGLSSFTDYLQTKAMFLMEDITYLGLPTPEGGALTLTANELYSIAEKSPVKEGAWQFISYMLTSSADPDSYGRRGGGNGFSALKSGLQVGADAEMEMYYCFNLDGSGWGGSSQPWGEEDYDPEKEILGHLEQADVDYVMQLLENARFVSNLNAGADEKMMEIINEELGAFYAGNADAATAARNIQSRVSIYLSEKS